MSTQIVIVVFTIACALLGTFVSAAIVAGIRGSRGRRRGGGGLGVPPAGIDYPINAAGDQYVNTSPYDSTGPYDDGGSQHHGHHDTGGHHHSGGHDSGGSTPSFDSGSSSSVDSGSSPSFDSGGGGGFDSGSSSSSY
ncbi:hypothetical protein [Fodinicola acaciae]|uniref:hypothetical protein n=1 Tax=Fodinicola acaciae TaxID=2681555 RepID=UPI0013D20139|nr:hypothetical protein [Fodinicola acaciae]